MSQRLALWQKASRIGAVSSATDVLERPDVRLDEETTDEAPEYFHYVRKNKIVESAVTGKYVVALCGEVFPVTKSPKPNSPICPECKRIYDTLRKGD